jgi:leucyl-tRNA synthetase
MAMGPLDVDRPWRTDDLTGVWRFLQRLWRNVIDEDTGELRVGAGHVRRDDELYVDLHRTIQAIGRLYVDLRFNVAVAQLTRLNNALTRYVAKHGSSPRDVVEALVLMLAPLAPHICAELWERMGHDGLVHDASFPEADLTVVDSSTVSIPVTVNGKVRGEISVDTDTSQDEAVDAAFTLDNVARSAQRDRLEKIIYVPAKILNLVVS